MSRAFSICITREPTAGVSASLSQDLDSTVVLSGRWEVALRYFMFDKTQKGYVCCDLVDYSYINGSKRRFFDFFNGNVEQSIFSSSRYVPVSQKTSSCINVQVYNHKGEAFQVLNGTIAFELHFRKI